MRMRRIAGATAVLALAALAAVGARADEANYPTRTVKVIVPLPPGAEQAAAFRVIADKLQERWGQPVVVEARPGASQNLGADAVARAEPDGYTLLFTAPAPVVTSKWMFKNLSYDPDAFTPVALTFQYSLVLTISPKVPASSFAELIAYAKANPGKLTYASPGVGTIPYLSMEALLRRAGISMVHVPYTRALPQGQLDLIAGRIDVILDPAPARAIEFHKEGKLKILLLGEAEMKAHHLRLRPQHHGQMLKADIARRTLGLGHWSKALCIVVGLQSLPHGAGDVSRDLRLRPQRAIYIQTAGALLAEAGDASLGVFRRKAPHANASEPASVADRGGQRRRA